MQIMIIIKISFSFIMEIKGMGWLNDAETELPYDKPTYFYQFCAFAGMDRKHVVRECLFKSPGKYLSIKTHKITPQDYRTLLKKIPMKYYKVYSTYDLDNVAYPLIGEALMMRTTTP